MVKTYKSKHMARPIKKADKLPTTGQSNYLTTAKYNYTTQEKRILYRVVQEAWAFVQQHGINLKHQPVAEIVFQDKTFTMHVTNFMTKAQKNNRGGYEDKEVYEAFLSLRNKDISGYNTVHGTWIVASIVNSAYKQANGMITFSIAGPVWQSALDFSAGWSPLDLTVAMELRSAYSMRFFEIARQYHDTRFWDVSVDEFRDTFGCTEKYNAYTDLKRYVINNSQKELDAASPWSFDYKEEKIGKKVTRIKFTFKEIKRNKAQDTEQTELLSNHPIEAYDPVVKNWLKNKLGLNTQQLKSNAKNFYEFQQAFPETALDELEETFQYIAGCGCRPQENIGWYIQNIKKKVENKKNELTNK